LIRGARPARTAVVLQGTVVATKKTLTDAQRTYEERRAAKAGMSLEKWLAAKKKERQAEVKAQLKAAELTKPPKPPGFFTRLLDKAHKPLRS